MVKKQNAIIIGIVIMTLFVSPVLADEMATTIANTLSNVTLANIAGKAINLLKPAMEANNITVTSTGNMTVNCDAANTEERLVNLLSNAIVNAPQGTEIKVSYSAKTNQVTLWVENSKMGYNVKRDVVDSMGNTFTLETRSGQGTAYTMSI